MVRNLGQCGQAWPPEPKVTGSNPVGRAMSTLFSLAVLLAAAAAADTNGKGSDRKDAATDTTAKQARQMQDDAATSANRFRKSPGSRRRQPANGQKALVEVLGERRRRLSCQALTSVHRPMPMKPRPAT